MINWIMMVVACALLVFLLYKEWNRKRHAHVFARMFASIVAVGSLLLMALPVVKTGTASAGKIVLLTDDSITESIGNFIKEYPSSDVFTTQSLLPNHNPKIKATPIADWKQFIAQHVADTLHVFGNGLSSELLSILSPHPIVFHANPQAPTIGHVYWQRQVETGHPLLVQGHYDNNSIQQIKLLLRSFDAVKDSIFIEPNKSQDFQLHTIPVHSGNALYSLVAVLGKDTLQQEPLPVTVGSNNKIRLLIFSSSPDFENTYLKNHLAREGYTVTVSSNVSTNKNSRQFLNTNVSTAGLLTSGYLSSFDVVMTDEDAIEKISATELSALRSAISKGVGLVLKLDTVSSKNMFYSSFFPMKPVQEKSSFLILHETFSDSNHYKINDNGSMQILPVAGSRALLQDAHAASYASTTIYGQGKITAITLQNTYSMGLEGNLQAYQKLWSMLVRATAAKTYFTNAWVNTSRNVYINEPVLLQTISNDAGYREAIAGEDMLYLKQDSFLPFEWKASYWPVVSGWQAMPLLDSYAGDWYVNNPNDWKQMRAYHTHQLTKQYADQHPVSGVQSKVNKGNRLFIHWPLLFLLLFLSSCIFLWVEQKAG